MKNEVEELKKRVAELENKLATISKEKHIVMSLEIHNNFIQTDNLPDYMRELKERVTAQITKTDAPQS